MNPTRVLESYGRTTKWRRAYIGGTFDLLHRGHLELFAKARMLAHEVVVSLNRDEFVARYKRPCVMPLADRLMVVSQLKVVDRAIVNFGDEDSRPAIEAVAPDVLIHGSDWVGDSLLRQMGITREWLESRRIDLAIVPYSRVTSSTQILENYMSRRYTTA